MTIKAIARGPWHGERRHAPWYEPFDEPAQIQVATDFVLSQDVSGLCTVSDLALLPLVLEACARFRPMPPAAQATLLATADQYEPILEPPA